MPTSVPIAKRIWVFSDLHLKNESQVLYQALLKTLREPKNSDDAVVFSGDIFDLLVGDSSYFKQKFSQFFAQVDVLVNLGVQLHYIEGNHDFHLKKLFPKAVAFHAESVRYQVPGADQNLKTIHIEHGDLVDQTDTHYLRLRSILRSKWIESASHIVPGVLLDRIASKFSRALVQKEQDLPEYWPVERLHALRRVYRDKAEALHRQGCDGVIFGHCHDLDELTPFYWNMGYPPVHRQFLFVETPAINTNYLIKRRVFLGF